MNVQYEGNICVKHPTAGDWKATAALLMAALLTAEVNISDIGRELI